MSSTIRCTGAAVLALLALFSTAGCAAPLDRSGGQASASESTSAFGGAPLVPDDGVYLGVYYGDRTEADTDGALGSTPQIRLSYFGWADDWANSDEVRADAEAEKISLVNWEPFDVDFADIVRGDYDEMLTQRGSDLGKLDHRVFLDFAAEMNEEEGWGGHDPELYIAAYRHIHDVVTLHDNGNAVWVWAPNNVDSEDAPAALSYYPGDAYVDWTGIDGYNWGTSEPGFEWQSFEQVFRPLYDDLHTLNKPIMIGETASAENGGSKAQWIADIVPTLRDDFPDIRAMIWFDVDKERDWRIRSSADSSAAFAAMATDPYLSPSRLPARTARTVG